MLSTIKKIKTEICEKIDIIVEAHRCSYIDAALFYCETNKVDVEQAGGLLSSNASMTGKIETEANGLNFLKKIE